MTRLFAAAALIATVSFVGSANAATITWDFNDNNATVDSNGLLADGVTTDDVAISRQNTTVNANIGNSRAQRDLGTSTADVSATFAFTLNIGATPINLTQLDFTHGLDVNAGSVKTNYFKWDLVITTTGSETPGASQTTFSKYVYGGNPTEADFDESVTLSGLDNLTNVDVTFAFTGRYGTLSDFTGGQNGSRFTYLDDVTFIGEVVPEPASLALLGLGGLMIMRRK